MIELRENHWAVEVPEGAKELHIEVSIKGNPYLGYKFKDDELLNEYQDISLPPGTWEIVCTSKEATEEQASDIVQVYSNGKISGRPQYRRYDRDPVKDTPARSWTRDARHALETLLTSKGCDLNKNYLIIKKG